MAAWWLNELWFSTHGRTDSTHFTFTLLLILFFLITLIMCFWTTSTVKSIVCRGTIFKMKCLLIIFLSRFGHVHSSMSSMKIEGRRHMCIRSRTLSQVRLNSGKDSLKICEECYIQTMCVNTKTTLYRYIFKYIILLKCFIMLRWEIFFSIPPRT